MVDFNHKLEFGNNLLTFALYSNWWGYQPSNLRRLLPMMIKQVK